MTLVFGPVESGSRYPPSLLAKALKSGAKNFGRPTNWIPLHPPFSHHACGSGSRLSPGWAGRERWLSGWRCHPGRSVAESREPSWRCRGGLMGPG